jgi:hypothetical protein
MTLTRTRMSRLLRAIALIVIVIVIAGYALWRSLPYWSGPSIAIYQPANGSTISSTTVTVIGRATRVNLI